MGTPKGSKPWNAGTSKGWVDKRGYRWLYVVENGRRRARREHRVIMEKHIERRLEPWEVVHHKDGDPSNNDLSNLEVQEFGEHTTLHHTGSRKNYQSKRSLEAFALVREELRHVRAVNANLLAALKCFVADERFIVGVGGNPNVVEKMIDAARSPQPKEVPNEHTGPA